MTSIDPVAMNTGDLVKELGERLIWEFPPSWVELASEIDPIHGVPAEWAAVVRITFTEAVDEQEGVEQRWDVWVGHDLAGIPLGARLAYGPLEITHSGWSRECEQRLPGDELRDIDEDNEHIHRRWQLAATDGHSVDNGIAIDPAALITAIIDGRRSEGVGDDDDVPERWKQHVAELVERKRRAVPEDLLPLLADQTIRPGWGSHGAWLGRPGALAESKVSVRCRPADDPDDTDYVVSMRFTGQLEESGREACAIADDLAEMLERHFCRAFRVEVIDSVTGIRGSSGELP